MSYLGLGVCVALLGPAEVRVGQELEGAERIAIASVRASGNRLHEERGARELEWLSGDEGAIAIPHIRNLVGFYSQPLGQISDRGVRYLARSQSLLEVDVNGSAITDRALLSISGLRLLRTLRVSYTNVGDDGLIVLAGMENLENLDLSGTRVTARGMGVFATLPSLRCLSLNWTGLDDKSAAKLAASEQIEELSVMGTSIGDVGVEWLCKNRRLKRLALANTLITDACVQRLAECENLKAVDVRFTKISSRGRQTLRVLAPALVVCD